MPKQSQQISEPLGKSSDKLFGKFNHQRIFYITPKQIKTTFNVIEIGGDDFHHLVNVLRLKSGDKVICKTYDGLNYSCTLQTIKSSLAIFEINEISQKTAPIIPQRKIGIFLCIPRPNVLANIVAKLTEVGVDFLQLVFSERSFFKTPDKLNLLRYEKIIQETLKQCGRDIPLELKEPVHLKYLQADFSSFLIQTIPSKDNQKILNEQSATKIHKILLWECEMNNALSVNDLIDDRDPIFLFVGPEGGISHLEKEYLQELGFQSKSISQNILKVETALLLALGKIL